MVAAEISLRTPKSCSRHTGEMQFCCSWHNFFVCERKYHFSQIISQKNSNCAAHRATHTGQWQPDVYFSFTFEPKHTHSKTHRRISLVPDFLESISALPHKGLRPPSLTLAHVISGIAATCWGRRYQEQVRACAKRTWINYAMKMHLCQ
jgi:hypothetical protein